MSIGRQDFVKNCKPAKPPGKLVANATKYGTNANDGWEMVVRAASG
jgi:hypothetical protein